MAQFTGKVALVTGAVRVWAGKRQSPSPKGAAGGEAIVRV